MPGRKVVSHHRSSLNDCNYIGNKIFCHRYHCAQTHESFVNAISSPSIDGGGTEHARLVAAHPEGER